MIRKSICAVRNFNVVSGEKKYQRLSRTDLPIRDCGLLIVS